MQFNQSTLRGKNLAAFSLIEVCVALAITVLVMTGMFKGYQIASRRAQYCLFLIGRQRHGHGEDGGHRRLTMGGFGRYHNQHI